MTFNIIQSRTKMSDMMELHNSDSVGIKEVKQMGSSDNRY